MIHLVVGEISALRGDAPKLDRFSVLGFGLQIVFWIKLYFMHTNFLFVIRFISEIFIDITGIFLVTCKLLHPVRQTIRL